MFNNESYAGNEKAEALKNSLKAVLGEFYTQEVFEFIYNGYKETFKRRLSGKSSDSIVNKLEYKELEIVFHDSFITYIEFYINS